MTERKTRGNREDCVDPVSALSRDNSIQETHRTISRKMSQPSAASRPTVEKTKHATVSSRGLFRETARMKHGAKQSKRHEMSTASIARTGCPESTPIAECCVDATTTNYMTANGGARRDIAGQQLRRIQRPKAGRSETRQTPKRLDTPTARRTRAARTMSRCHAPTTAPSVG